MSKGVECTEDTCLGVKGECKGYGGVDLKKGDSSLPHHGEYPTVKGRLHSCIRFWREELCAPHWVLNTLEQGYVLPFTSVPAPFFHTNQHSAIVNAEFVNAELVAGGYVKRVEQKPTVCSPLSVVVNGVGKKRLVVNLKHVNRYLTVQKFKYEDLRAAMLLFKPDVMSVGVWPLLKDLEDPELRRLAQSLPATVLRSRADSTSKKYLRAYQRWKTWAEARHEVPAFPVQAVHLALYLQHLSESVQPKTAAEEAVHALSWLHEVAGLESVGSMPIVQATLSGLRRVLAKPKTRKEPITADMLKAMVVSVGSDPSQTEVRLLSMCLIAFAGFLRCDELIKLKCSDITINSESMVINVASSKTDQYREGSSLIVARTRTETCPVSMLEKYFAMGGLCHMSHAKVFRGITKTKTGEKLQKSGGLSYSRAREILLEKIKAMGWDPSQFGMHSLRAGGATAAANAGVPDRLFKRHGRWRSDTAKDGYVKDSVEKRLEVSKHLGL